MKAEFNNDKKTKRRKTLFFCLFLAAVIGSAVIFASKAAEQTGLYWIGADNEKIAETPEDNRGFFTVDVSDFLRNAGALSAEAADKAENTEVVPLAIGPLPSVPTLTDDELKLYGVLSQNNGEITSGDKDLLDDGIHWTEVVLEPGETLKSIAEEFNISEEDLRMANGLKKNQKPSMTEVLFVPNSHEDVMSTMLFVRKLQHEDVLLAKKGKPLNVIDYYVKEGDTLWKIANKFDLDIDTLVASN
ncbi:MAG: LysM peptidoglycan-binding domain-containing protein, partial [Synergistes sp.]|nr:LysM peptidoglycan-binding domain-containing protein [Synergistes sp.]